MFEEIEDVPKAGNSDRRRKNERRMSLKDEAQAMRLRLAKLDDKVAVIPNPTGSVPMGKQRSASPGRYSAEMLKKKVKKVEKLLGETPVGSKEYKKLHKKLIEYRTELQNQEKPYDDQATIDSASDPAEMKEDERLYEQNETANYVDSQYAPITVQKGEKEHREKEEPNDQEEDKGHSIEMLKKKLKKVEKMLRKSTPGSREHKKLQKKQIEYEKQIEEQECETVVRTNKSNKGSVNLETRELDKKETLDAKQNLQGVNESFREEARLLRQKALERRREEEEEARETVAREEARKQQARRLEDAEDRRRKEKEAREARAREEEELKRKETVRKEARRLKEARAAAREEEARKKEARRLEEEAEDRRRKEKEAREARVREEEELKRKETVREEARRLREARAAAREEEARKEARRLEEEAEDRRRKEKEAREARVREEEELKRKETVREEARRLREARAAARQEEETKRKAEGGKESYDLGETDEERKEPDKPKPEIPGISVYMRYGDDEQKRKEAFLEEARKLKQDAMEKKRKKEELERKANYDAVVEEQPSNLQESKPVKAQSSASEEHRPFDTKVEDDDDESHEGEETDGRREEHDSSVDIGLKSKENGLRDHLETSTLSLETETVSGKPDQLGEIRSNAAKKEDGTTTPVQQPSTQRPKPSFLDDIRSKAEKKENDTLAPVQQPSMQRPKPSFLDDIRSKAAKKEEDTPVPVQQPSTQRPKPSFLDDIRSKAEKKENDTLAPVQQPSMQRPKPSFLDDIRSKAAKKEEDTPVPVQQPSTQRPKPSFLDDIRSKAEKKENDTLASVQQPSTQRPKPSFLDDIRSKAAKKEEGTSTPVLQPSMQKPKLGFFSQIRSKAKREEEGTPAPVQQPSMQKPKLGFLSQIRSKAKKEEDTPAPVQQPSTQRPKLGFLTEIRSKSESMNEERQLGSSIQSAKTGVDQNSDSLHEEIQMTQQPLNETSGTHPPGPRTDDGVSNTGTKREEPSKDYLDLRALPEPYSNNTKKILGELEANEIRQKRLERSLMQNGIPISEDISYDVAKDKIAEITESMKALSTVEMDSYAMEKKYFHLEEQLSKYTTALMLTDEYAEESRRLEQEWDDSIESDNIAAIEMIRSHMPVKIRHMTEEQLSTVETPNGKTLPKAFARKFKRTNILQLIRVDPEDIEMMHPSLLEGMRTTGLTLTERRALHHHLRDIVERWAEKKADPSIEKKWQWYQMLRSKFKETLNAYLRCVNQYGPPGDHQYAKRNDPSAGGCPLLGNQCPLKADAAFDYSGDYGYTKDAIYENSSNPSGSKKQLENEITQSKKKLSETSMSSEAIILQEYRSRLRLDPDETEVDKKLLRELYHSTKRTQTLEKQLRQAGLTLPDEDIPYSVAKTRVAELTEELKKIAVDMGSTSDAKQIAKFERTFEEISQQLEKYTSALMLTKEWAQEQKAKELQWEIDVSARNQESLRKVRRHMPVDIKNMSESSLATDLTPNGKTLPKALAKKFKRTNILMILRTEPSVIEQMHPSSLEAMRTTGLTLTERRAIHEHLKEVAPKWKAMTGDKMCERKWMWHASLLSKLKEMLEKYDKHVEQYGPPENHNCTLIGNQCPIKADLVMDYNGDYGYPEGAEYEQQAVAKSNLLSMEELEKRRREDDFGY